MKTQKGFTLIELVMVIVILGILAATALPKFVDLGSEARAAVIKSVAGSMRGANTAVYAKAASNGQLSLAPGSVTINGTAVATTYGYAASGATWTVLLDLSPTADFNTATSNVIYHTGAPSSGANCRVTYTPASLAAGVVTPPGYVVDVTAC